MLRQLFRNTPMTMSKVLSQQQQLQHRFLVPRYTRTQPRQSRCYCVKAGEFLLTADDRVAIMELSHRFDQALNQQKALATADLFTEGAQLHTHKGTIQGSLAISVHLKAMEGIAKGNRHLTMNMIIEVAAVNAAAAAGAAGGVAPGTAAAGEAAAAGGGSSSSSSVRRAARATSHRLLHKVCSPPILLASGTIEDELVMGADGVWRIATRRLIMDPPSSPPAPAA